MVDDSDDEKVGYCRPPKKHQQKAGEPSKGPNGRRGNKPKLELGATSPPSDWNDQLADALIEEATMPLNDKRRRKPPKTALHAFARSMVNEAVKATSAAAQTGYFNAIKWAFDYKAGKAKDWNAMLLERQSLVPDGDIWPMKPLASYPDPKDVVANPATGEFWIDGPKNDEEYRLHARALEELNEAAGLLHLAYEKMRDAASDEEADVHWEVIEQTRATYLHFNSIVGRSHRVPPDRLMACYPDKETYQKRQKLMAEYGDEF